MLMQPTCILPIGPSAPDTAEPKTNGALEAAMATSGFDTCAASHWNSSAAPALRGGGGAESRFQLCGGRGKQSPAATACPCSKSGKNGTPAHGHSFAPAGSCFALFQSSSDCVRGSAAHAQGIGFGHLQGGCRAAPSGRQAGSSCLSRISQLPRGSPDHPVAVPLLQSVWIFWGEAADCGTRCECSLW